MWMYLKGHPDVFMPAEKELYFFDSDLWAEGKKALTRAEYLSHFSGAAAQKRVGEATPSYLRSQSAAEAIKSFLATAQIIIMLRNPVDVMYSLHSAALDGLEPTRNFETALKEDATRTGGGRIGYREFADFPDQVERYFDEFGREKVHTIIFDDLKENSAAVLRDVLRFLDIGLNFAAEFPWIHANRQCKNADLEAIMVRPHRSLRSFARALVPPRWRSHLRNALSKSNHAVRPRPPMDPALRRRLQKEFEPKIERLSRMLVRDLSAWSTQ